MGTEDPGTGGKETVEGAAQEGAAQKGVFVRLPVELHRQIKSEAALSGKTLGEFAEVLFQVGMEHLQHEKAASGGHGEE